MKKKAVLFVGFLWILVIPRSKASNPGDTNHIAKPHGITTIYTEPGMAPMHQWQKPAWTVDTTLNGLQYYISQYILGNTGAPVVPVIFCTPINPVGFNYGNNYIAQQLYTDTNIRYYNTRAPYTKFYYVTDPKIHQFIHFIHSQNIGKNFNFALEFQRTRSQGVYLNQGTNINQLTLSLNYHLKRYVLFANGIYDYYKLNQNGGITSDTTIGDAAFSNRQTVPVNISSAFSLYRDKSFHIKQYFFFGYGSKDSLRASPLLYISHSLRLAGNSNVYDDPGPLDTAFSFYKNIYKDSTSTYDSLHYIEWSNDLSIGSAKAWPAFLRWEAGVTDQQVRFKDGLRDSLFNNLIAHACIYDTGRMLYNVQGSEIFSGTQQGDMKASAAIGVFLDSAKMRSVRIEGNYASQTPPLIYELYYGNNLMWLKHFNRMNTSTASLIYRDEKWHLCLTLSASQIQNLTYFDVDATPRQYNATLPVLSARLQKNFTLGKWHLNMNEIYQYVQDSLPLRLPQFVLENSFFYENYLFHHNLLLRVGTDVFYNASYYGYAYMPITGQYYLENQTKLGDYVYIDPFVSFRIKTFKMFIRLENAGSKLLGANYFYALHTPYTDRVLRFGISWDFWN